TTKPFPAFTFYFRADRHGLWRVHAYQYAPDRSTFIVECREETWLSAGMDKATEEETARYLEDLFAAELAGHRLITNRSVWRQFPTVRVSPWSAGNVVLLGDAAHTAHFSVGSGTRMAMEDAAALRDAMVESAAGDGPLPEVIGRALAGYEARRRPHVESLQRAAQASLEWFVDTERYTKPPPIPFAFSLLTRSLRITHEDLRERDPAFLTQVDRFVAERAAEQVGRGDSSIGNASADRRRPGEGRSGAPAPPPPMFTPFRLR